MERAVARSPSPDVVLLTELYPPAVGGTPVLFENVYTRLDPHRVTVLTDAIASSVSTESVGAVNVIRGAVAPAHWDVFDPRMWTHHLRLACRLRQIARGRPVLVHCARALPEGLTALVARLLFGLPYIVWAHGEEISTLSTSRALAFLMRRVVARALLVVANSGNTASLVRRTLNVSEQRIRIVHPGVDPARFRTDVDPSDWRERLACGKGPLLLTVGRLQRRKGHDTVIQAVAALAPKYEQLCYAIAGTGPEEGRLRALADSAGVADRVRFLGNITDSELPSLYAACDVFVHPNRVDGSDIEGFGIVFLEAQSSGRPVIGGRSGGVAEAVADGESGLLVSGECVEELVAAISRLITSQGKREHFGRTGRQRVLEHFTWEHAAAKVRELHLSLRPSRAKSRNAQGDVVRRDSPEPRE